MDDRRTVTVRVSGHVQGVYFRAWTVREAQALGLDGWVRNRRDGSVEAVFSGPAAVVATMLDLVPTGPPDARVDAVEIDGTEGAPPAGFTQRPTG